MKLHTKLIIAPLAAMLLHASGTANAQTEYGVGFGSLGATGRDKDIDVQFSSGAFVYLQHTVRLSWKFFLRPSLQFSGSRYIMDGLFAKDNNGNYGFYRTPDDYKQSSIEMQSFRLPVMLTYSFANWSDSTSMMSVGFGPYAEYYFAGKQRYKIGTEKYDEKPPLENRLQYGLAASVNINGKRGGKGPSRISYGFGCTYQLSEFVSDMKSFKPLNFFGSLGFVLGKRKR